MKKLIALVLTVALVAALACSLTGCGEKAKPIIGVIQFGSHGSLNNCYDGIVDGLTAGGVDLANYDLQLVNSNFDPSVSQTQANSFVNKGAALILAIATPSAVQAATAADGKIPVVFCAVTDQTTMENYDNVTGSSDIPNFEKQLELICAFMGRSDFKIGVLYSTDESSSPVQVANLKKAAEAYAGMQVIDSAVADITTIDTRVNDLISQGADCFVNLLDNTIVGKLESNILPITNEKKIPVFGSEIEQVKVGCVASSSIDYRADVGFAAGKLGAKILSGEKADDLAVETITNPTFYYNAAVCEQLGISVPASITATDVNGK